MSLLFWLVGRNRGRSSKSTINAPCSPQPAVGVTVADEAGKGLLKLEVDLVPDAVIPVPVVVKVYMPLKVEVIVGTTALSLERAELAIVDSVLIEGRPGAVAMDDDTVASTKVSVVGSEPRELAVLPVAAVRDEVMLVLLAYVGLVGKVAVSTALAMLLELPDIEDDEG